MQSINQSQDEFSIFFRIIGLRNPEEIEKIFIDNEIRSLQDLQELTEDDLKSLDLKIGVRKRILTSIAILRGDVGPQKGVSEFWRRFDYSVDGIQEFEKIEEAEFAFYFLVRRLSEEKKTELIEKENRMLAKESKALGAVKVGIKEAGTLLPVVRLIRGDQLLEGMLRRAISDSPAQWAMKAFSETLKVNLIASCGLALSEIAFSVWDFSKGKISGRECSKRITQSLVGGVGSIGGAFAGSIVGTSIGSIFGLYGALVGYALGNILGSVGGYYLGTILNQKIWRYFEEENDEKARQEILQAAFDKLNTNPSMTWREITKAYRSLVLTCHPDKFPNVSEEQKKRNQQEFCALTQSYKILEMHYEKKVGHKEIEDTRKLFMIEYVEN